MSEDAKMAGDIDSLMAKAESTAKSLEYRSLSAKIYCNDQYYKITWPATTTFSGASLKLDRAIVTSIDDSSADKIRPKVLTLTDDTTGNAIDFDYIKGFDGKGVTMIIRENMDNLIPTYSFIPASSITVVIDNIDEYPIKDPPMLMRGAIGRNSDDLTPESSVPEDKYVYDFGIDDISLSYVTSEETSGIISDAIDIGACSYISLSAKIYGDDSSYEFYIIDGASEVSILPVEQSLEIIREKIFPGLPTRFNINMDKGIKIYDGDKETELTIADMNTITDKNHYISYTANADSIRYVPKNKSIRVKIIQRLNGKTPSIIKAITLQRFGGEAPWTMLA